MVCVALLALSGCGDRDHGHADDGGEAQTAAVSFKEGHGLRIASETARALGVAAAPVEERPIAHRVALHASVVRAGPPALVSASVSPAIADVLERHPPREAKIVAIDRSLAAATGNVELTLELPDVAMVGAALPLALTGSATQAVAVPAGAILRSATGTFVYVANGDAFLRTPVTLGASDGDYVEITDGIYEGDEVVVSAVEQLWLTELRLTKGGGHSH